MPPSGAVSSMADSRSSLVLGNDASASRARRRCAARSPRLLPSATYARSGRCLRSALDGKVACDPLKVRRQLAELPDGTL